VTALGRKAITVGTDVNDDASAQNLVDRTIAEFRPHRLAGQQTHSRFPPLGDLETVDFAKTRAGFETKNVLGALRLSRMFLPIRRVQATSS